MKIVTQDGKYINEIFNYGEQSTNYHEKIKHMIDNGYGSIVIDNTRVSYVDTVSTDDGDIVFVNVGD